MAGLRELRPAAALISPRTAADLREPRTAAGMTSELRTAAAGMRDSRPADSRHI